MTALQRSLLAEALGTAGLVLFATGAAVVNAQTGALGLGGVAAVSGLIVLVLIQLFGPISGAHVNPAVTVAFWAAGRFAGRRVLPYIGAQLGGALVGSALVRALFPASETLGATLPVLGIFEALGVETILTFWLVLLVLHVAHGSREQGLLAGLTIGAAVTLEILVGGPLSGGSMNPARSLAPALVSGHLTGAWIYVVGPLAGALLAVATANLLRSSETDSPDSVNSVK
ncbi:MAG: aquaporin [Hymenobacteraceae bacterium]|nr:aquaporin [Hymenobacteraceae bacterium]